MSDLETLLLASIDRVELRKRLARANDSIEQLQERYDEARHEIALLQAQLRLANAKLEKYRRSDVATVMRLA